MLEYFKRTVVFINTLTCIIIYAHHQHDCSYYVRCHMAIVWWLICAMSYKRVFRAKMRKGHALRFRLLFVVSLLGGAKGRHAKTRQNQPAKITIWQVFAWRPFAFSPRKHDYTTWHKSATTGLLVWNKLCLVCLVLSCLVLSCLVYSNKSFQIFNLFSLYYIVKRISISQLYKD